jgi:hypothetical protein
MNISKVPVVSLRDGASVTYRVVLEEIELTILYHALGLWCPSGDIHRQIGEVGLDMLAGFVKLVEAALKGKPGGRYEVARTVKEGEMKGEKNEKDNPTTR